MAITILPEDTRAKDLANSLTSPFAKAMLESMQSEREEATKMKQLEKQSALQQALDQQKFQRESELEKLMGQKKFERDQDLLEQEYRLKEGLQGSKNKQKTALLNQIFPGAFQDQEQEASQGQMPQTQEGAGIGQQAQRKPIQEAETFDPSKLSDAQIAAISAIDSQTARVIQSQKEAKEREIREQKKFELNKEKFDFQKQQQLNTDFKPDIDKARTDLANAQEEIKSIKLMQPAVSKGETGQFTNFQTFAAGLGIEGLWSPEQAMLVTGQKQFLAAAKSAVFSKGLTNYESSIVLGMTPNLLKSPEANQALLDFLTEQANFKKAKAEILLDLYRKNKGNVYPEIFDDQEKIYQEKYAKKADQARDKFIKAAEKYQDPTATFKVIDPEGTVWNLTSEELETAFNEGWKLL